MGKHLVTLENLLNPRAIAQRIRSARIKLDWTMSQLAEESQIKLASISLIESGQRTPSLWMLLKLCPHLRVSIDYVLGITPLVKVQDMINYPKMFEFFEKFNNLTIKSQDHVISYAEFLSTIDKIN